MNDLASRLMILRGLAGGISQRELARLADISTAYPGIIERSTAVTAVSGVVGARIAAVFGCSLDYLLMGVGEVPSERVVRAAVALALTRAEQRESLARTVEQEQRRVRDLAQARADEEEERRQRLAAPPLPKPIKGPPKLKPPPKPAKQPPPPPVRPGKPSQPKLKVSSTGRA